MNKIAALAEQKKKKNTDSKRWITRWEWSLMGADYDGITTWWDARKKKKAHQDKLAALGACGMAWLTLWLMQQLSNGGKIRGKVAHLQRVIQPALQTFVTHSFNLLLSYQTRLPESR